MAKDRYIEQRFPIKCSGRNHKGERILDRPIDVKVVIYQRNGDEQNIFSIIEECPYNTGGHGQRCKASHPEQGKVGDGVICPYSFDIPDALDNK